VSPSLGQRSPSDTSFERLYRRHRRDVYGAVLRDIRDPDEAEDVTQIAFLNAFRAIRRGEEPEKPRAWLVTIARNVVRRRYQALARRPQEVALDPEVAADLTDVNGPTAGEIAAAIRRLPANQRAVILLREIQGRSYAEIAEELKLSLAAVETLIFRARRSMSEELQIADHAPTTQRRARGLRGLLAFPLPGLGKFSLGFSLSRAGVAAVVGGVAIVTVPIAEVAADRPLAPAVQRSLSHAEMNGPSVAAATEARPAIKTQVDSVARPSAKKGRAERQAGLQDLQDGLTTTVGSSLPVQGLGVEAPSAGALPVEAPSLPVQSSPVPSLPVQPPPLAVEPPPLPVEPPPLPVEPPALPVEPPALPVEPLPVPSLPPPPPLPTLS
jgi:RNA polymerase sigma-70 factor, ECF subfamily